MKAVAFFILLLAISLSSFAQIISSERRVNWKLAGLRQPLPVYSNIADITTFGGNGNGTTPNDAALQAAIASLGADSGIVYFPAGTFVLTQPVFLRSGLVLRGKDAASTTLQFTLTSGFDDLISMLGNTTSVVTNLVAPASKNDSSVVVADPSLYAAGDYVKLFQNDSSLVFDVYFCVGQILQIENISGDTITFSSPLRRNYKMSDLPRLRKLLMVTGSGVECLKIRRLDSTAMLTSNVLFRYAAHCWVKGVESDTTNFAHVSLNNATNIEITGSYFHGSYGYGPGGQGYGVAANLTTGECLVENNIFRHLRHAIVVQSGSNGNVFSLNYVREGYKSEGTQHQLVGDIVLHGNYPYANLFESNIVNNLVVDFSHGINGPFNTLFRNRAQLYGILFSTGSGDSTNIVGNEVTSATGGYIIAGNGNFEYGNNVKGTIAPLGTNNLTDASYYYTGEPYFWFFAVPYPTIGIPNNLNFGTIPAKAHFDADTSLTECPANTLLAQQTFVLSAERKEGSNLLTWQVSNSSETKMFEVERSTDGHSFSKLATITASASVRYNFTDVSPFNEATYYRIFQHLKSGNKVYSKVISLKTKNKGTMKLFPNPAKNKLLIALPSSFKNIQAVVRNVTGERLLLADFNFLQPVCSIDVSLLKKGNYFVEVIDKISGSRLTGKFLKE